MNTTRLPLLVALAAAVPALAETAAPAAKTYGPFFAPVAIEDRRAMSIDRPNISDSPYSVNSGVLQVETSALEYTKDTTKGGTKTEVFAVGTTNVRIGLKDNWELQTIVNPYTSVRSTNGGAVLFKDNGFGDTTLRSRYVLQGNDGSGLGVALLPYLKLPTNQYGANDKLEGGFEVPLGYALNDKTVLVAMPGVELLWSGQSAHHYDPNPFLGVALWRTISSEFSGFVELYGKKNTGYGTDSVIVTGAFGGIYQVTKDIGVDAGLQLGLTEGAPDLFFKTGVSFRF